MDIRFLILLFLILICSVFAERSVPTDFFEEAVLIKSGDDAFIRTNYDADRDLVQKLNVFDKTVIGDNNPFNFNSTYLIPNSNLNTVNGILNGAVLIHNTSDDSNPMNYNGTCIGANHGCYFMLTVNSISHGKSVEDCGSEWTDGTGRKYYILRAVNSDQLWMISEDIGAGDIWNFDVSLSGSVLNHSKNALHTATINVNSFIQTGLEPAIKDQSKKMYLSDGSEVMSDGIYFSENIKINESYSIVDPSSALDFVISHTGSITQPDLNQGESTVDLHISYLFDKYGGCSIEYSADILKTIDVGIISGIQSNLLNKGNYQGIFAYIPGSLPIYDGKEYWDFRTIRDYGYAPLSDLKFFRNFWENADEPPYRFVQCLGASSSQIDVSFVQGFNIASGSASAVSRSLTTSNSVFIPASSRKMYPIVIDPLAGDINAGKNYLIRAFRSYSKPKTFSSSATFVFISGSEDELCLSFDYHGQTENDTIFLPDEFKSKIPCVRDKTESINIVFNQDSNLLTADCSGNYGYAFISYIDPVPPDSVRISYGPTGIGLSWNKVADSAFYGIYRSFEPGAGFEKIGTTTSLSFTDDQVIGASKVFYRITTSSSLK